jgi:hypothetical protein
MTRPILPGSSTSACVALLLAAKADKGRQRPTKADKGRQKADKGRQRSTNCDVVFKRTFVPSNWWISYHGTQLLPQNIRTLPGQIPFLLSWQITSIISLCSLLRTPLDDETHFARQLHIHMENIMFVSASVAFLGGRRAAACGGGLRSLHGLRGLRDYSSLSTDSLFPSTIEEYEVVSSATLSFDQLHQIPIFVQPEAFFTRQRPKKCDKVRQRPTKADKGRQRPTKADKVRLRSTKTAKDRQRSTNTDKGRQRSTNAGKGRQRSTICDVVRIVWPQWPLWGRRDWIECYCCPTACATSAC